MLSSKDSTEARIEVDNISKCFGELIGLIASSGSDCGPRSPDSTVVADSVLRGWFKILGTVALQSHAHIRNNLTSVFEDANAVPLLGQKGPFLGNNELMGPEGSVV